ncbi:glycosylphosphatidylinositol anchor biosynthesis [Pichia californica]|nr:glycosylphosphatidylinositol anchor biosynthesis [[Candida] californica]
MKLVNIFQILALLFTAVYAATTDNIEDQEQQQITNFINTNDGHTNNWAVIISTSRFWFNYRHMANALSMYRTVKRLGIPDSQIILMLSDDIACNPRNAFQGEVFNNADRLLELYGDNIKVDYRGYEVTVENFIRLLTDRWPKEQPRSKRLLTDENSNIFIYLTGHGGDEFLKFQDAEEISSYDIADAFEQMYEKKRYNEIFFMIDTCQANTMYSKFYSPNIISCGSSALHESSYSHHSDVEIGVAVIDRFTYFTLEFLENITTTSTSTLNDLFDFYTFEKIHSNVGISTDLFDRDPKDVLITDFFGNVQKTVIDEPTEDYIYVYDGDKEDYEDDEPVVVKIIDSNVREIKKNVTESKNVIKLSNKQNSGLLSSFALLGSVIAAFALAYSKF